jgi:hypothetical protein
MSHPDPATLDRRARELRRQEIALLLEELACLARRAWIRLAKKPAAACGPCGGLPA